MLNSVADLVETITPYVGQDCQLKYRVRTNKRLNVDEDITGWTIKWLLFDSVDDDTARLEKAATVSSPYALVNLSGASDMALTSGTEYFMQLWRDDSGFRYPLTGIGSLVPQPSPASML